MVSKGIELPTTIDTAELISSLATLPALHQQFERNPDDLNNFIRYVNLITSLKKKAAILLSSESTSSTTTNSVSLSPSTSSSSTSSSPVPSPQPQLKQQTTQLTSAQLEALNLNNIFIYIDKLKKSPSLSSDLFEISTIAPLPYIPTTRNDHYPPVSTAMPPSPIINKKNQQSNNNNNVNNQPIPKFNQAIYYNCENTSPVKGNNQNNINNNNNTTTTTTTTLSPVTNGFVTTTTTTTKPITFSITPQVLPLDQIGNRIEVHSGGHLNDNNLLGASIKRINCFETNNIHSVSPTSTSPIFNYVQEEIQSGGNETNSSPTSISNEYRGRGSDVENGIQSLSLDDDTNNNNNNNNINNNIKITVGSETKNEQQVRGWSLEFWKALQMEQNSGVENLLRSQQIQKIAQEFVEVATKHGKTIIQERGKMGSIPFYDVGGVAGGKKFLIDGIFFKFAFDVYGIYGGDQFAMKAAGHELKGLMGYFNCNIDGLYLPLMALIDYMGYRLIATSQLAIGKGTLVYGSDDQGENVHDDNEIMSQKMQQAAEIMNLKGHMTGQGLNKRMLYGPCDIEGHLTYDNHFVVIDTARIFPPERPLPNVIGSHLYNLLRPELVRSNKVPLSSDAFTKFAGEDKDQNNEEVERAQKRLFCQIIPNFVLTLNQKIKRSKATNIMELSQMILLIDSMHREGINVRYLNRLKKTDIHALDFRFTTIINTEIMARKIKNRLREFQRSINGIDIPSIVQFLNRMFIISLLQSCDIDGFSLELLIHRLSQMTGIVFTDSLYLKIEKSMLMQDSDIISLKPKVKFLHMVPYQQGVSLFHQGIATMQREEGSSNNNYLNLPTINMRSSGSGILGGIAAAAPSADSLFQMAAEKFKLAIQSKPDDFEILTHWGMLLGLRAKSAKTTVDAEKLYEASIEKFQQAVRIKRNYHYALYQWSEVYKSWASIKPPLEANTLKRLSKNKLKEAGVFEKKWFFGTLETNGAASLLSGKEAGSFIIRNSNSRPGSFVFSYLSDPHRKIQHSIIKSSSQGYHVENLPSRKHHHSSSSSSGSSSNRTSLNQSNSSVNSNDSDDSAIQFNESNTPTSSSRTPTALSSSSHHSKSTHYKTLEEFVSDKIKQGYIPITLSIN